MSYPAGDLGITVPTHNIYPRQVFRGFERGRRDAVMGLLVLCALVMGAGILLLVGFLSMAQELLSKSIFGVPHEPDEETGPTYMDEERSTSSSSTPIG